MKTVLIGLGNPILTDDSVGIKVARAVKCGLVHMSGKEAIDVKEVYAGGIRLMDAMTGYERAFIVDAMVTGRFRPGDIIEFGPDDLCSTRNIQCTHDTNLATALEFGEMLGLNLPSEIRIWGIEADDVMTFGEELTDEVAGASFAAAEMILKALMKGFKAENNDMADFDTMAVIGRSDDFVDSAKAVSHESADSEDYSVSLTDLSPYACRISGEIDISAGRGTA